MKPGPMQAEDKGWRRSIRFLLKWTKALFTPIALGFLAYFAWRSREVLTVLVSEASLLHIGLAVVVWGLLHMLAPAFAALVLNACGSQVTWRAAFATHASRLPARYVPGGIWHTVGRIMDYSDLGVRPRHLTAFVLLENGLAATVTLALGGAIVFAYRGADAVGIVAGLSALGGLLALPVLWLTVDRRVLGATGSMKLADYLRAAGIVLLFWAGAAAAFMTYLTAFPTATQASSLLEMAGIYLFSWGVGFLSVFAPQGIGVFEVVAAELLEGSVGLMSLAVLIGGFRAVVLLADILTWGIYRLCNGRLAAGVT